MQGTIEQLPMASRPGSILIDGVGRAWFRPSDVLGGTPQLGARVSVRGVRRSQQSLLAEEVYILPPPLGPLEEGNDTCECASLSVREGKALVSLSRRLAPGKGGCAEQVMAACKAFLTEKGLDVAPPAEEITPEERPALIRKFGPLLVCARPDIFVEWNFQWRVFQVRAMKPAESLQLCLELAATLQCTCFQGWKQEVAGKL